MTKFSLWLDKPDALDYINAQAVNKQIPAYIAKAAKDLVTTGFTVLRAVQDESDIDQAVKDYYSFVSSHEEYSRKFTDPEGRHYRLANFHVQSEAACRIGKNPKVMALLDFLFSARAMVYISLTS